MVELLLITLAIQGMIVSFIIGAVVQDRLLGVHTSVNHYYHVWRAVTALQVVFTGLWILILGI